MMKNLQVVLALASIGPSAFAADLLVPSGYPTIQSAIDASTPGDVIVISAGTYAGGLSVTGKSITLRAATPSAQVVIDGQGGEGLSVVDVPAPGLIIRSLKFTGCLGSTRGAALRASGSSLDIAACEFTGNRVIGGEGVFGGGAIFAVGCSLQISGSVFSGNSVELTSDGPYPFAFGGAIMIDDCAVALANCNFVSNSVSSSVPSATWAEARSHGGAFAARESQGTIVSCTFSANRAIALASGYGPMATSRGSAVLVASKVDTRFIIEQCDFVDNVASTQSNNTYYAGAGAAFAALSCGVDGSPASVHVVRQCRFIRNRGEKLPTTNGTAAADVGALFGQDFSVQGCQFERSFATALTLTQPNGGAVSGSILASNGANSGVTSVSNSAFCALECPAIGAGVTSSNNTFSATCCPADLYPNGFVNGADLGILLSEWGPSTAGSSADLNGDGAIDGADLGILLGAWGPCPN